MKSDAHNSYFLYARKSTDEPDRQIRSIDDQLVEMRQLAAEQGIRIVEVLIEKQSAKTPGRPIFNEMLSRIERGEASGILAWHADRLARNSLDGGRIIYLLDTGTISKLVFKDSVVEPTSNGKLMLAISFGMSKYHSDSFSDGIKRVYRRKIQEGIWPLRPPLGYLFDRTTRTIILDPTRAPLVRKAFELYASGRCTLMRLRAEINALGLMNRPHRNADAKPLSTSQYQYILTNPFYHGLMRFNGELHQGKHPALVSKALFDTTEEILECRSKPNVRGPISCLYRGTFRCGECGASITSEIQKGNEYLRCTKKLRPCSQRYLRIDEVTRQVTVLVNRFAVPDDLAEWMIRELEKERRHAARDRAEAVAQIRESIKSIDEQLRRLLNLQLQEAVSLDEYRSEKNRLVGHRRELDDQLIALETTDCSWLEPAIAFIQAAKTTVFHQNTATDEQKRDFLRKAGSNLKIHDKRISLVPRGAWKTLVDSHGFCPPAAGPRGAGASKTGQRDRDGFVCPQLDKVREFFKDNQEHSTRRLGPVTPPAPFLIPEGCRV